MLEASVALFDGQPLFLHGLRNVLAADSRLSIVATGGSAADAVALSRIHGPDLVIMELMMEGDAFYAIREICAIASVPRVIVCTASASIDDAVRALEAGASGYVLKGSTQGEVLTAVDSVLRGETFINQCFATKVIAALRQAAMLKVTTEKARLSLREQQIVQLLLRGRTNREIAQSLCISEKTVKHYMTVIMQKLHARNRLEVVIAAQQMQVSEASQLPLH
jgi:DNA-binding NarL/FixJ family response regulator